MHDQARSTAVTAVSSHLKGCQPLEIQNISDGRAVTLSLRGSADASALTPLRSALSAIDLTTAPTVTFRLTELEFCDVPSAHELVDFAYDVRSHGGKVCVAGSANVYVQVLLTILDISGDLSLGPVLSDRTA